MKRLLKDQYPDKPNKNQPRFTPHVGSTPTFGIFLKLIVPQKCSNQMDLLLKGMP